MWSATIASAVTTTLVPGLAGTARAALGFPLTGHPGSLAEALTIAATNLRFVTALHLAGLARRRLAPYPALTTTLDAAVFILVLVNAGLPGVAVGAYGVHALPFVIHLPLEWWALSLPLATYCSKAPCRLLAITVLLTTAALAESFLTPQR